VKDATFYKTASGGVDQTIIATSDRKQGIQDEGDDSRRGSDTRFCALKISDRKQMVPIYDSDAVGTLQQHFFDQPEGRWRCEMNQTA
jgi:hypothetical protein